MLGTCGLSSVSVASLLGLQRAEGSSLGLCRALVRKGFSSDGFTLKQETSECPVAPSAANAGTDFGINSFLELFFLLVSAKNFGESTKISWTIQLIFRGPYN